MPTLRINPPRRPSQSSPSQQSPPLDPATAVAAPQTQESPSPVAPAYSPITPTVQPALPAHYSPHDDEEERIATDARTEQQPQPGRLPAHYVAQPAPLPFSSENSTDALALRAAISSLQFQKKKAQEDIRALARIRQQALEDPPRFKSQLAAGKLKEQRLTVGDLRAILDASDDDDEENDDAEGTMGEGQKGPVIGAQAELGSLNDVEMENSDSTAQRPAEVEESHLSGLERTLSTSTPFEPIPGPQNVVRMPYINWEKYHIVGEPLDRIHEQQRRWPGSFDYGRDRGREHTVAAPYSPWLDHVERKGSGSGATPSVSEHPMETRRRGTNH